MKSEAPRVAPDPYRVLFPLGAAFAIAGAVPWLLYALGRVGWPGPVHAALMIEGFEFCFVLGFLLTALPALTHGARTTPAELAVAAMGPLAWGTCLGFGLDAAAFAAFTLTLAWLAAAAIRRVASARQPPPEEFVFIGLALMLGLAGGVMQCGAALEWWTEPSPRFGLHLVAYGMVLALVLGVGGMLVPVFAGIRDPLVIPGVSAPHERRGRRVLYAVLAVLFVLSFVVEGFWLNRAAELLRAIVATTFVAWVWKLTRLPGRRALGAWAMWLAGWCVALGAWLAALFPLHAVAFHHLVFIGGYGLLTLAIATRVVIGHGRHPVGDEARAVTTPLLAAVALALLLRLAADWLPPRAQPAALAASGVFWIAAWIAWSAGALPRIAVVRGPAGAR